MIYVIIYSKNINDINFIKNQIDIYCSGTNYTYLSFEYPMDILDYLNASKPKKCALFYVTENYSEGTEISKKVYEINPHYRFTLLCTEYDNAENLFYNGVTYYVKTPYCPESIMRSILFMKEYYKEKVGKYVQLKSRNGTESIRLADINYVMSDKRKIVIKTATVERTYYYKLDEIEKMLGEGFLRCHQSFIVNMTQIKKFVEDGILLTDETFIPASRKRYYASKKEYLSYITDGKVI